MQEKGLESENNQPRGKTVFSRESFGYKYNGNEHPEALVTRIRVSASCEEHLPGPDKLPQTRTTPGKAKGTTRIPRFSFVVQKVS